MQMRKGFHGLIILSLLVFPSQMVKASTIKTGGACLKLNQTQIVDGYRYSCIKLGKNLIWSKGVSIPKATPSPSPSPSLTSTSGLASNSDLPENFVPWSTNISVKSVSDAAQLS